MIVGLMMNAGVSRAFADQPWLFVVPNLLCRLGPALLWAVTGTALREHYAAMATCFSVTAIPWVVGAAQPAHDRIWWWGAAAALELTGTWLAHPLPGRHRFRTQAVQYEAGHMLERSRLFLLIALGEAILAVGSTLAAARPSASVVAAAALSMVAIVALWALYFGGSDKLIAERAATTSDPLRTARLAVNTQILVLASLIGLAVATDLAVDDPVSGGQPALGLLLFGGPALYVAVQTVYFWTATGRRSLVGPLAVAILVAGAMLAIVIAPLGAAALLCAVLLVLVTVDRRGHRTGANAFRHGSNARSGGPSGR